MCFSSLLHLCCYLFDDDGGDWDVLGRSLKFGISPSDSLAVNIFILVMPWYPPLGRRFGGDVSFWYGTYCAVGLATLAICGIYDGFWSFVLPKIWGIGFGRSCWFWGIRMRRRIGLLRSRWRSWRFGIGSMMFWGRGLEGRRRLWMRRWSLEMRRVMVDVRGSISGGLWKWLRMIEDWRFTIYFVCCEEE